MVNYWYPTFFYLHQMAFLSVTSDLQHGIRIICIRERFALNNRTHLDLDSKLLALPLSLNPIQMCDTEGTNVVCPGKRSPKNKEEDNQMDQSDNCLGQSKQDSIPMFRWSLVDRKKEEPKPRTEGPEEDQTFVCYIAFSKARNSVQTNR